MYYHYIQPSVLYSDTHFNCSSLFRGRVERMPCPWPTQVFHTSCFTWRSSCLCSDSTGSSQTCPSALKASGFHPSRNTGVYGATGPLSWELRECKDSRWIGLCGFYCTVTTTMMAADIVAFSFWMLMSIWRLGMKTVTSKSCKRCRIR